MTNSITTTVKKLNKVVSKNSPGILTAMGVAGLFGSVFMAIDASRKADQALEQEIIFRHEELSDDTPLTLEDKILVTWKFYAPTAIMVLGTAGCIIGSHRISRRRQAVLASLLAVAERGLNEYQAKVVETIGEKKEETIRGEIAADRIAANPPDSKTIIFTGNGTYLCQDSFSKQYFRSTKEAIERSVNKFNQQLLLDGWLGINEFYYELGLESIELGDEMGWIAERQLLEVKYVSKMATLNGATEPCCVIDYQVTPHHL
jgi:hypothetical protein